MRLVSRVRAVHEHALVVRAAHAEFRRKAMLGREPQAERAAQLLGVPGRGQGVLHLHHDTYQREGTDGERDG